MTMPQQHTLPEPVCRRLTTADLAAIASIHCEAFSNGILTAFGPKCIEKYYAWHMEGKHGVATLGLEQAGTLIAYCVLLRRNQFSGFLQRAFPNILGKLFCSPSLAVRRGFDPGSREALVC